MLWTGLGIVTYLQNIMNLEMLLNLSSQEGDFANPFGINWG